MSNNYQEKLKDPRWQKKRLKIFERDGWACTACGSSKKTLVVHHKKYIGENPWNAPDEYLETLCNACHRKIHNNRKIHNAPDCFGKWYFDGCVRGEHRGSCPHAQECGDLSKHPREYLPSAYLSYLMTVSGRTRITDEEVRRFAFSVTRDMSCPNGHMCGIEHDRYEECDDCLIDQPEIWTKCQDLYHLWRG